MCDIKKYEKIYQEIARLEPEDTLQLVLEADTEEQRDFYQASPAASVQSCQKYPGRNERSGHCLTSLET